MYTMYSIVRKGIPHLAPYANQGFESREARPSLGISLQGGGGRMGPKSVGRKRTPNTYHQFVQVRPCAAIKRWLGGRSAPDKNAWPGVDADAGEFLSSLLSAEAGTAALLPHVSPVSMVQFDFAGWYWGLELQESRLGTETVSGGGCACVSLPHSFPLSQSPNG
ncbi:hypothetical protein LY78DRAFT_245034 [Colletotrichum sublineola]|nr:hypothetical protein LY78DRAFT_245034 [Colletotrichum sublineola]